jgi:hypothetical protein
MQRTSKDQDKPPVRSGEGIHGAMPVPTRWNFTAGHALRSIVIRGEGTGDDRD